mgnify:CR=1 FL=1
MIQLPEVKYQEIDDKLPLRIFEYQHRAMKPNVDLLVAITARNAIYDERNPETKIDIAAVCLRDCMDVSCQVIYALRKANENLLWYREENAKAPLEIEACWYSKFYADDAALRLYAAAEHIANFIIAFMNIQGDDLNNKKGNASVASTVGKYMNKKHPDHIISKSINKLLKNDSWLKTIEYRNQWVHEQPPLIEGQGIVYERKSRLKTNGMNFVVGLTTGDKPDLTIDSLLSMVTNATNDFACLLDNIIVVWFSHIDSLGISI